MSWSEWPDTWASGAAAAARVDKASEGGCPGALRHERVPIMAAVRQGPAARQGWPPHRSLKVQAGQIKHARVQRPWLRCAACGSPPGPCGPGRSRWSGRRWTSGPGSRRRPAWKQARGEQQECVGVRAARALEPFSSAARHSALPPRAAAVFHPTAPTKAHRLLQARPGCPPRQPAGCAQLPTWMREPSMTLSFLTEPTAKPARSYSPGE